MRENMKAANDVLSICGSRTRFSTIVELFRDSGPTPSEVREILAQWWNLCDGSQRSDALFMFRFALLDGFGPVMDESAAMVDPPRIPSVVYRGASAAEVYTAAGRRKAVGLLGLSWTSDRDKAAWFANRTGLLGQRPLVLEANLDRATVLGLFDDRNEAEVVLDTSTLRKEQIRIHER